mmetsp:Transcript_2427/g.9152  ORF Transcript_2427/g.9152 Transcript_2427/m.9152 type:complete len:139 (-) Transcript_2427:167-583(-)
MKFVSDCKSLTAQQYLTHTEVIHSTLSSSYMSSNANSKIAQIIKHYIKDNNCMIFSKTSCPFCLNSKSFFDSKGIRYKVIEVDRDPEYQDELEKMTGQRTVPNIWINQKFIGGNSDLMKKYASGELFDDFETLKKDQL